MFDLQRFVDAQSSPANGYRAALNEVKQGCKEGCWIWYIFPQLKGLGSSEMAEYFGIDGLEEAKAYLKTPILRKRLIEITQALLDCGEQNTITIFGYLDSMKVLSCMTLFATAEPSSIFDEVIDTLYDGQPDNLTLEMLKDN